MFKEDRGMGRPDDLEVEEEDPEKGHLFKSEDEGLDVDSN
jgi:hypothetical protein